MHQSIQFNSIQFISFLSSLGQPVLTNAKWGGDRFCVATFVGRACCCGDSRVVWGGGHVHVLQPLGRQPYLRRNARQPCTLLRRRPRCLGRRGRVHVLLRLGWRPQCRNCVAVFGAAAATTAAVKLRRSTVVCHKERGAGVRAVMLVSDARCRGDSRGILASGHVRVLRHCGRTVCGERAGDTKTA